MTRRIKNPILALNDLRSELERLKKLREDTVKAGESKDIKKALFLIDREISETQKRIAELEVSIIRGKDVYL